jgi:hypothetical protein
MRTDYKRLRELEEIIGGRRPDKLKAAQLIFEDMSKPKPERKGYAKIAEEIGISERQLRRWRGEPEFIEYLSLLSSRTIEESLPVVTHALIRNIDNGKFASNKAIEIFYRLLGMLTDRQEVEHKTTTDINTEDLKAQIEQLKAELRGEETKE